MNLLLPIQLLPVGLDLGICLNILAGLSSGLLQRKREYHSYFSPYFANHPLKTMKLYLGFVIWCTSLSLAWFEMWRSFAASAKREQPGHLNLHPSVKHMSCIKVKFEQRCTSQDFKPFVWLKTGSKPEAMPVSLDFPIPSGTSTSEKRNFEIKPIEIMHMWCRERSTRPAILDVAGRKSFPALPPDTEGW